VHFTDAFDAIEAAGSLFFASLLGGAVCLMAFWASENHDCWSKTRHFENSPKAEKRSLNSLALRSQSFLATPVRVVK
jgi:hypothetical protein